MKNKWFKHYNTAHEGQLIGDLIVSGKHEAALLVYMIMELISRFEDENERGKASVPIERIARGMNMKPSKIDRLIAEISSVSRSDLVCEVDEELPRNRVFVMRKWLELQETRGGKREAKKEQNTDRSKKLEVRYNTTTKKQEAHGHVPEPVERALTPVNTHQQAANENINDLIKNAWEIWIETRSTFNLPRINMSQVEERSIARAINQIGYENVCLAIEGQRHEERTDKFDPSKYLKLDRVLHRNARGESRWDTFRDLALKAKATKQPTTSQDFYLKAINGELENE